LDALDSSGTLTQDNPYASSITDDARGPQPNAGGNTISIAGAQLVDEEDSDDTSGEDFEEGSDIDSDGDSEEDSDEDSDEEKAEEKGRDNEGGTEDTTSAFPRFSKLPAEIQRTIWELAVPHPRDIPESILVFVNFDLNRPRAILPAPTSILGLYEDIDGRSDGEDELWDLTLRTSVLSLLHTCHNSRASAGAIFSLDVDESVEAWNAKLWDPATDTLYLPGLAFDDGDHFFQRWLADGRDQPHFGLRAATHVALKLDMSFLLATKLVAEDVDLRGHYFNDFQDQWLENLPSLKTLTLCIDPLRFTRYWDGHAVPYPSLDVPIYNLDNYTPSKIQEEITEMFELHLADLVDQDVPRPDLGAPLVEIAVLCWRNTLSKPWKADLPARSA
jgi:hypothetical protein